ncbi:MULTISPECIES: ketopantoate reductase family protein [Nonomuraea]|uniref:Ketopantoate reductase family protein n=1 Tax=Nonomuraea mangrovi TaxID=2316207 RepID=A0ABW4TB41_9ACTN
MHYAVIGAGAVGGTIGGRLFQHGHDVTLIARGRHYEALREQGLRLATPDSDERLSVPVADGPVDADVLVVATKSQDTIAALESWPTDLPVVCAQNGVANERMALRRFERVYGMCVYLPALHMEPGVVAAFGSPLSGRLHIGRYPQGVDELAETMAGDLSKSAFDALAVPDVMRWKYGKLLGNLGNAVEALCGREPGINELFEQARAEGLAVLAAAGIEHAQSEPIQLRTIEGVERGGGSSWQSLARGSGSIEADYLNGEIALLGRMHGVATPVNEVLQREAGRAARERRGPGSMTVGELSSLIAERSAA